MSELAVLRCPLCRRELEYAADWYDTPLKSERAMLESHVAHRHADKVSEARRRYLLDVSAIPSRLRQPVPTPVDEPAASVWREAGEWWRDCRGEGNLLLYGPTGVGKTSLAARILLRAVKDEASSELIWAAVPYWLHVGDFARRAKRLLATGKHAEFAEIIERAQTADYLFADDLGAERPSEFVRDLLADLIEYRYDHDYGSIVATSNYSPDQLAARLGGDDPVIGDRLIGRLVENAEQLHYPGRDRRLPDQPRAAA